MGTQEWEARRHPQHRRPIRPRRRRAHGLTLIDLDGRKGWRACPLTLLPSHHLAIGERRFALSVREKHPLHRHDLPDHRGQTACHVSGCALGVLRYYVPRGRRRWSGRGSVLNINPRFRNEITPRVDGASQAYVSLESSFRLIVVSQRKGTRFPGNTVEVQDSSINLAFCALLCIAAPRGVRPRPGRLGRFSLVSWWRF